jgi:uncharacterized protein involved in high-affinity Fe2+ transport
MKKVFLSLAVVAMLTVVSCKKAEAPVEAAPAADTTAVAVDTAAVAVDTAAVEAAPATETPAAEPAATPAK